MKTNDGQGGSPVADPHLTTTDAPGLVPVPGASRPLAEAQQRFRKLLARVEFLREAIETEEQSLDSTLSFYAAEIVPRIDRQTSLQKALVRGLAPRITHAFFPHKQSRMEMKELIQKLLDEIAKTERGLADPDLRGIYDAVHDVDYAEQERKSIAAARDALARMFAEAGIEADFSELDGAASEADFLAKAEELTARVRKIKEEQDEAERCRDLGHHSTDDEQVRAAEELRKRSVAIIYRQLARVLHPDLERDSERQKQKVELMQELTVAFRQNDLHTLLRLEMQWIEKEGGDIERLTDDKLGVYNDVLKGQVEGLERQLRDLPFHPRYRPIVSYHYGLPKTMDGPGKAGELDGSIAAFEQSLALMETASTAAEMQAAVQSFRIAQYPAI